MTDDRKGAIALIAGALGGIVTMILHPSGGHRMTPAQFESMARLAAGVHALAIASMPVLFLGAIALSRRLAGPDRLALAALVIHGSALVAVIIAATLSGFVAPDLIGELIGGADRDVWHALLAYNGRLNQAFAKVFNVGSSVAIVLWSTAILKHRTLPPGIGWYGWLIGLAAILAIGSGRLRLDVHGQGLVIIGQAVWFIAAGQSMWRPRSGVSDPTPRVAPERSAQP